MRLRRFVAAWGIGAVLLAGCGESKSRVVSNGGEKVFLKVPSTWAAFELATGRSDRLESQYGEDVTLLWQVGLDGSGDDSGDTLELLDRLELHDVDQPVGRVQVYEVVGSFAHKLSLSSAREAIIGIDPLFVGDDIEDPFEIVDFIPRTNGGIHGSRVVFNYRANAELAWQTYDVTTEFDVATGRMYVVSVGCSATCFKENNDRIFDVTNSWTVNK